MTSVCDSPNTRNTEIITAAAIPPPIAAICEPFMPKMLEMLLINL